VSAFWLIVQIPRCLVEQLGMNFRKLLGPSMIRGPGAAEGRRHVINTIRARGCCVLEPGSQATAARLQKNDLRLFRDYCLDAVLRVVGIIAGRNRAGACPVYQIVNEAPGARGYQRLDT
jgi:hypothetical protein